MSDTQKVTLADIASPTPSKEASKVLNKALKKAYKKMSNTTSTELEDIFTRHIQMLRTSRPDLERAIEAYVAQKVRAARAEAIASYKKVNDKLENEIRNARVEELKQLTNNIGGEE